MCIVLKFPEKVQTTFEDLKVDKAKTAEILFFSGVRYSRPLTQDEIAS